MIKLNPRQQRVDLELNKNEILKTDLVVVQWDNKSIELNFKIFESEGVEIDYSSVSKATMVSKLKEESVIECECVVEQDCISYLLCYDETNIVGNILSEVCLFGEDEQKISTQKFQYMVIPTLAIGINPNEDKNLPILQQLISSVINLESNITTTEALRVIAEQARSNAEINRNTQEDIRNSNELIRTDNETSRIQQFDAWTTTMGEYGSTMVEYSNTMQSYASAEDTREIAEQDRVSSMQSIEESYSNLVTELTNNLCLMEVYKASSQGEIEATESIFMVPSGYDYDITHVILISHGDAVNIDSTHTSTIELLDQNNNVICSQVFNDLTPFPSSNSTFSIPLNPDFITENSIVFFKITNSETVNTPEFLLQVNYIVKKIIN